MRSSILSLILVVALSTPFGVWIREAKSELPDAVVTAKYNTRVATVLDIDQAKYTLKVKGEAGRLFTLKVDPDKVKNFGQIKKGDMIKVQTERSVAITLAKAEKGAKPSDEVVTSTETAAPGEKPGMRKQEVRKVTAELMNVDLTKGTIELKGVDGNTLELKAKNPQYLPELKIGDMITATYNTELAISVIPAPSK